MATLFIERVAKYGGHIGRLFWHSQMTGGGAA